MRDRSRVFKGYAERHFPSLDGLHTVYGMDVNPSTQVGGKCAFRNARTLAWEVNLRVPFLNQFNLFLFEHLTF